MADFGTTNFTLNKRCQNCTAHTTSQKLHYCTMDGIHICASQNEEIGNHGCPFLKGPRALHNEEIRKMRAQPES